MWVLVGVRIALVGELPVGPLGRYGVVVLAYWVCLAPLLAAAVSGFSGFDAVVSCWSLG